MATAYTKMPQNRPNGHKIYQHSPLQDPRKFTKIGFFGLKIYHLTIWFDTSNRGMAILNKMDQALDSVHKGGNILIFMFISDHCCDHYFQRFSPIFSEKNGAFSLKANFMIQCWLDLQWLD
jgi:hypothetical protein